jgi:pimeloyl-ACP methyl ester carboxylesterase
MSRSDRQSRHLTPTRIGLAVALGAAGAGWEAARRADRRRLLADPEWEEVRRPLGGREQTVTAADGTKLHAEIFGPEDAPTIVLAHGWVCQIGFWHYQLRDLSDEFRVVAYDQRGHGRSEPAAEGDYTLDAIGDDLQAVLEQCVDGQAALVAGHSLGGMTIVAWAGRHESEVERRTRAAALINTGMGDIITGAGVIKTWPGIDPVVETVGKLIVGARAPIPKIQTPISTRIVGALALGPDARPAHVALTERMAVECSPLARAAAGHAIARIDLYDALASLTVPTLVIAGERDRLTPRAHADRIAELLANPTELVVLPRCGHMGPLECHEEVTEGLRRLAQGADEESAAHAANEAAGAL